MLLTSKQHTIEEGNRFKKVGEKSGLGNWKVYRIFYDFTQSKCPSFSEELIMLPGAFASYLLHTPAGVGVVSSEVQPAASDNDMIVSRKQAGSNSFQLTQYFPASLTVTNPSGRDVQFQVTSSSWQDSPLTGLQAICRVFVSTRGGAVYATTGFLGTSFCNDPLTTEGVVVNYPDNSPVLGSGDCSGRRMSLVGAVDPVDLPSFVDPLYLWSIDVNGGDGIQAPMGSFNCSTGSVTSALTSPIEIPATVGDRVYAAAWVAVETSPGSWEIRSITPTICFTNP